MPRLFDQEIPEQTTGRVNSPSASSAACNRNALHCVQNVRLQINLQHLKDFLMAMLASFPGVSLQTKEISLADHIECCSTVEESPLLPSFSTQGRRVV